VDEGILSGEAFELVISGSELVASIFLQVLSNGLSEANVSVEASADSGTTLSDLVNILKRLDNTLLALLELVNVGTEFLTKSERGSILGVGTANLANVLPLVALGSESLPKADEFGEKALVGLHNSGDVHN